MNTTESKTVAQGAAAISEAAAKVSIEEAKVAAKAEAVAAEAQIQQQAAQVSQQVEAEKSTLSDRIADCKDKVKSKLADFLESASETAHNLSEKLK